MHIKTRSLSTQQLLTSIQTKIKEQFTATFITSLRTQYGNTQSVERIYIEKIGSILTEKGISYESAGSQQSKDFRNVGGTGLNLEIKKTDSFTIKCNDTCPSQDIEYIIISTKQTKKYNPQVICINGLHIVKTSPWLTNYLQDVEIIKNKYCRGDNKKNLCGMVNVYTRPNIDVNIRPILQENPRKGWALYELSKKNLLELCKENKINHKGSKKKLIERLMFNNISV